MRRSIVMIVNPASGRGTAMATALRAKKILKGAGAEVRLHATDYPGQGRALASDCGGKTDVLVSVGGDGTLNEVVNGVVQSGALIPIALIPMGTANAVSGALGIPDRFEAQVKLALESRTRLLDLGKAGERLFIMCAGVGFDAVVVHDMSRIRVGRSISLFSYIVPTLRTLFRYPHGSMQVSIDGKPVEAASYFTVIGNLNRYGGPFRFFTDASPSDGLLDVCCLRGNCAVDFCRYAIGALMRKLSVFHDVYTYRGRRVVVTADRPLPVQTDGDPGGRLPMTFSVLPEAALFCVP